MSLFCLRYLIQGLQDVKPQQGFAIQTKHLASIWSELRKIAAESHGIWSVNEKPTLHFTYSLCYSFLTRSFFLVNKAKTNFVCLCNSPQSIVSLMCRCWIYNRNESSMYLLACSSTLLYLFSTMQVCWLGSSAGILRDALRFPDMTWPTIIANVCICQPTRHQCWVHPSHVPSLEQSVPVSKPPIYPS